MPSICPVLVTVGHLGGLTQDKKQDSDGSWSPLGLQSSGSKFVMYLNQEKHAEPAVSFSPPIPRVSLAVWTAS